MAVIKKRNWKKTKEIESLNSKRKKIIVAIYARKSKFSEKGESIVNQINYCKEEIEKAYPNDNIEYIIYDEDEGYSGKNTNRPGFNRMMIDARNHKIAVICCYRLDRISRSVSDFSILIKVLSDLEINFICVREKFDLTTPMGRAMMYIASVFAQLERETIAERIRDNMYELAQTGRWLGGTTPMGFLSEKVNYVDGRTGKNKTYHKLINLPEELDIIKIVYAKYLETGSFHQVETYMLLKGLKTKNNFNFSRFTIRKILSNPVYAKADNDMYDFLNENGCNIYGERSEFDGIAGLIAYKKTSSIDRVSHFNDIDEWIVAVGEHQGIISGKDWASVQLQMDKMKCYGFTSRERVIDGLLSGILVCKNCGSPMIAKATGNKKSRNRRCYSYICTKKIKSRRQLCDSTNIDGLYLDDMIVNEILNKKGNLLALYDTVDFKNMLITEDKKATETELNLLNKRLANIEKTISHLIITSSEIVDMAVKKEYEKQIASLIKEKEETNIKLSEIANVTYKIDENENDIKRVTDILANFDKKLWNKLTPNQRHELAKKLVLRAEWDGRNVDVYFFNENNDMQNADIHINKNEICNNEILEKINKNKGKSYLCNMQNCSNIIKNMSFKHKDNKKIKLRRCLNYKSVNTNNDGTTLLSRDVRYCSGITKEMLPESLKTLTFKKEIFHINAYTTNEDGVLTSHIQHANSNIIKDVSVENLKNDNLNIEKNQQHNPIFKSNSKFLASIPCITEADEMTSNALVTLQPGNYFLEKTNINCFDFNTSAGRLRYYRVQNMIRQVDIEKVLGWKRKKYSKFEERPFGDRRIERLCIVAKVIGVNPIMLLGSYERFVYIGAGKVLKKFFEQSNENIHAFSKKINITDEVMYACVKGKKIPKRPSFYAMYPYIKDVLEELINDNTEINIPSDELLMQANNKMK